MMVDKKDIPVLPAAPTAVVSDFSKQDLGAVPESLFFSIFDPTASSPEVLLLNNNRLVELPHVLWKLKSLKRLNCSHNNIKWLPDTIGKISYYYYYYS